MSLSDMLAGMTGPIDSEQTPPVETAPGRPTRRLGLWLAVGAIGVALIAAAVIIPISISNAQAAAKAAEEKAAAEAEHERLATFADAFKECNVPATPGIEILDGGESVSFSRVGKYNGPDLADVYCFLKEVDAPTALESKIGATRALDGAQRDEWPGYKIEWRYHPDDGATLLVEHAE